LVAHRHTASQSILSGVRVTIGMAATNTPIVTLNQRLGFVPEPMWITFHKTLV
jgi:hypothetical protein